MLTCARHVAESVTGWRVGRARSGQGVGATIVARAGQASIQTTERYLGLEQDLTDAPSDHLGLRL